MTRILVPIDYSEHSRQAVEFASALASGLKAELHLLYVWETMPHFSPELQVTTPSGPRSLEELVKASAAREMAEFVAGCRIGSVRVETHIDSGLPVKKILDWIAKGKFDFVTLGTHGRGGVKHWVLGSVAERITKLSAVPVITVGPRRDQNTRSK